MKLFISHSSKTDQNIRILEQVCIALEGHLSILVDKRIKPNDEWFSCLYEYINECHAAVVFLSKAALSSEWVKVEAAILCNRRRTEEKFILLLVPLDGLIVGNIDREPFFNAIRISDFQAISGYQNANDISNKILNSLQNLLVNELPITPFEIMTNQVQSVLRLVQKQDPDEFLKAFESALKKINPCFVLNPENLGESLARVLFRDPLNIFTNLKIIFIALSFLLSKSNALKILDIVKGYWVHPEAGLLLSKARNDSQAVAITAMYVQEFSGDCYSRQAWPAPTPYKIVVANKSDTKFDDIEQTLLSQVPPKTQPERLKKQYIANFNDPLLLVFPYQESNPVLGFPSYDLLNEIKDKLKNVTIIVSTGENFPTYLDYVRPLEPLLTQQEEDNQYTKYSIVNQYIAENLEI